MIDCPACGESGLAPSGLRLGNPAFPLRCRKCGGEFHGSLYWLPIVSSSLLAIGALVLALGATSFFSGSTPVLVTFGAAALVCLGIANWTGKNQRVVATSSTHKGMARTLLALLAAYAVVGVVLDAPWA